MHLFREAEARDEDAILELARHLNTLNLPPEREVIRELLEGSVASFGGGEEFDPERRFVFVLEEPSGRVLGTSMVHAQHGVLGDPHVYFSVTVEERYAEFRGEGHPPQVHMKHTMLQLGQTYEGPTELGGLVLHPDARKHPARLGRLLSLGRFNFIASFRPWIRDRLLAELLPPLYKGPSGATRSPLWDALGHRFTGLSYEAADKLSRVDKRFIWDLFPRMPVHASLLPEGVQEILGQVGPNTMGAFKMLSRIGFDYVHTIDPFDGGPHVEADTDTVVPVRDALRGAAQAGEPTPDWVPAIVSARTDAAPHFRAVTTEVGIDDVAGGTLRIPEPALARLGVKPGAPVLACVQQARGHKQA